MKQVSASSAKQNFGELLTAAALGPVAIERHQKVAAIICSPALFNPQSTSDGGLAERRAARAAQAMVEKDRLIRHQRLAIRLLTASRAQQLALVASARAEVARWRQQHLCSADYIAEWSRLLDLPPRELACAMAREDHDGGSALRQNSPWPVAEF